MLITIIGIIIGGVLTTNDYFKDVDMYVFASDMEIGDVHGYGVLIVNDGVNTTNDVHISINFKGVKKYILNTDFYGIPISLYKKVTKQDYYSIDESYPCKLFEYFPTIIPFKNLKDKRYDSPFVLFLKNGTTPMDEESNDYVYFGDPDKSLSELYVLELNKDNYTIAITINHDGKSEDFNLILMRNKELFVDKKDDKIDSKEPAGIIGTHYSIEFEEKNKNFKFCKSSEKTKRDKILETLSK